MSCTSALYGTGVYGVSRYGRICNDITANSMLSVTKGEMDYTLNSKMPDYDVTADKIPDYDLTSDRIGDYDFKADKIQ